MQKLALQQRVHAAHDSLRRCFVPDLNSSATPLVSPVGGSSRWSRPRMLSADACISQVKPPSACAVQTALSRRPLGRLTPLEDWSAEETRRASNPESREDHSASDVRGTRAFLDFPPYMVGKLPVAGKEINPVKCSQMVPGAIAKQLARADFLGSHPGRGLGPRAPGSAYSESKSPILFR